MMMIMMSVMLMMLMMVLDIDIDIDMNLFSTSKITRMIQEYNRMLLQDTSCKVLQK